MWPALRSEPVPIGLLTRSHQLAEQLHELRARVREAVAAELGRVVADAVRDLLTATLRGRPPDPERATHRRSGRLRDDPSDDTDDREPDDKYDQYRNEPDERPPPPGPTPNDPRPSTPWASAISVGIMVARWLLARRLRVWPSIGASVAVSMLSLVGGPAVRAAFAAVATALELVCLTQTGPD